MLTTDEEGVYLIWKQSFEPIYNKGKVPETRKYETSEGDQNMLPQY